MADVRNRVSITLTDSEMEQVKILSERLGIKPTRVVYEALKEGMPLIFNKNKKFSSELSYGETGLLDTTTPAIGAVLTNASLAAALGGGAGISVAIGSAVAAAIEKLFSESSEYSKDK